MREILVKRMSKPAISSRTRQDAFGCVESLETRDRTFESPRKTKRKQMEFL